MNLAIRMPPNSQPSKIMKQLLYRCWHRGMKEVDLILGPFLEAHHSQLSPKECQDLDLLLACNDQDLMEWILKKKIVPTLYATEVILKIQSFAASLPSPTCK